MEKQTIKAIKDLFHNNRITEEQLQQLYQDERKGVQSLLKSYERKREQERALREQFSHMQRYEKKAYENGCHHIAGVDEVGRGPLAGPVVAAAVILPKDFHLLGLNDSKLLREEQREHFSKYIKEHAVSYHIAFVDNQIIDEINIYEATKQAMTEAIGALHPYPDYLLVDAVTLPDISCPQEAIIKGDASSISIAAASVLAKVARDNYMKELAATYPAYRFDKNMGYGTKAHLNALEKVGTTPYHRASFSPVKEIMKRN